MFPLEKLLTFFLFFKTNLDAILLMNALFEKIYLKLYKVIIISRDYKSYKFAQIVCHCQVVKFKTWNVDITLC